MTVEITRTMKKETLRNQGRPLTTFLCDRFDTLTIKPKSFCGLKTKIKLPLLPLMSDLTPNNKLNDDQENESPIHIVTGVLRLVTTCLHALVVVVIVDTIMRLT